ncbi:MAG TPA: hypothetical protein VEK34_08230 [Methylocella sp.]|nr:hypothetical protein [Methylocella sp.]
MTTETSSSVRQWLVAAGAIIWALLIGAFLLPFALGYLYAWTWVVPYVSVCKDSLLHSDFTADEYRLFLLNHGCSLDVAVQEYVVNRYADLNSPAFPDLPPDPGPPRYSSEFVSAQVQHAIAFIHGTETPQSDDDGIFLHTLRSWLGEFKPFTTQETNCQLDDFECMIQQSHTPDFFENLFLGIIAKYAEFAGPKLLDSTGSGAEQMSALWSAGALTRGGLLAVYALLSGLMINAVFELIKLALKS